MSRRFIPVYQPSLLGREREYVLDCIDSTWISSKGRYIAEFESRFARLVGAPHALGVCNGTVAVHLTLLALGIGPGDEVIVPTLTYVASVNPVLYVGAKPVFADSDRRSWQLDPAQIRKRITPRTRAIMAVHLYGHPSDMDAILPIAREHGLFVIEDCAEAIGSRIGGRHVGTFGDIAAFSFFGNKTITTGEGGMVVTGDATLADRVDRFKGQGLARKRVYWHDMVGYNYRMTNICAAIGCAQIERVEELLRKKRELAERYHVLLAGAPVEPHASCGEAFEHSYWMYSILVPEGRRDGLIRKLADDGIETRPLFYPVHTMPMYANPYHRHPVAEELSRRGLNLPSWPDLPADDQSYVAERVRHHLSS
jgi:perosamine synthetase